MVHYIILYIIILHIITVIWIFFSDYVIQEKVARLQKRELEGFGFVLRGAKGNFTNRILCYSTLYNIIIEQDVIYEIVRQGKFIRWGNQFPSPQKTVCQDGNNKLRSFPFIHPLISITLGSSRLRPKSIQHTKRTSK